MKISLRMAASGFLLALLAVQATAADFKLDAVSRKKLDAAAERMISDKRTPGMAIGIMSQGKIIYAKGFGRANLETGSPVTPDSVFRIGSLTKQFTGAAIVALAEQGKLEYDAPISQYLPDFPRGGEVTVRELLNHVSGIHDFVRTPEYPLESLKPHTTEQMVSWIKGQQNLYDFEPGTSFRYSNAGYFLLGAIIEKASGMPLRDFLKQNIFDRAGMAASALDQETDVVPNRVSGYSRERGASDFSNASYISMTVPGAAGSIRSTIGDLLRWQEALLAGQVISPAGVKAMTTPGVLKDGKPLPAPPNRPRYAFGVGVGEENGRAFIGHNGAVNGFSSTIKIYPNEHLAYVVLVNTDPGPNSALDEMDRTLMQLTHKPN